MPLTAHILDHPRSKELEVIRAPIDANPPICLDIPQDLNRGKAASQRAGAKGLRAGHVPRCIDVKTLFGLTNQELDSHIVDSRSLHRFCRIGLADKEEDVKWQRHRTI